MVKEGLSSVNLFLSGQEEPIMDIASKRSTKVGTLYTKRKDIKEVLLENFQVLKVLGRGSFGKVCLVEYKPTKELYAMKSLKKDVLIDQDQIENTLLEKKILETIDHPSLSNLFSASKLRSVYTS